MSDERKGATVTSYNQSGGITAHTVSVGLPPRHVTAQNREMFAKIPRDAKVTIAVSMDPTGEMWTFAGETLDYLKTNGYVHVGGIDRVVWDPPIIGQQIAPFPDGSYEVRIGPQQ